MVPDISRFGFGRIKKRDLRDYAFALPRAQAAAAPVRSKWWFHPRALDQGATSRCCAFASYAWMLCHPNVIKPWEDEQALYDDMQKIDGIPLPHDGSTVRAAFALMKAKGVVDQYNWATDVGTAANFILTSGPMVFGTIWTDQMMEPDKMGFLTVGDTDTDQGHAYYAYAVDLDIPCPDGTKGAIRVSSSWSESWSLEGHAWIGLDQLAILLKEDGEACCATKGPAAPVVAKPD